ncbi:MAG: hypothetical protein HC923_01985 [Myxococcales bacterium]|nr:hypothetical protein [Myxococcales bacterium]
MIGRMLLGVLSSVVFWLPPPPSPAKAICPADAEVVRSAEVGSQDWACVKTRGDGTRVLHGWSVTHEPDGSSHIACEYVDGVLHGHFTRFAEEGSPLVRGTYDHGSRTGYWWLWSGLEFAPAPRSETDRARPRRFIETLLLALDVPEDDVPVIAQYLLDSDYSSQHDIRTAPQLCARSSCVSAAMDGPDSVIAVQFDPPPEKFVEVEIIAVEQRAAKERKAEERAAAKREAAYEKALAKYESDVDRADRTRLVCNDGTRSPSCICGGGWQGCCSHHGGVSHCPATYPTPPLPPDEP